VDTLIYTTYDVVNMYKCTLKYSNHFVTEIRNVMIEYHDKYKS